MHSCSVLLTFLRTHMHRHFVVLTCAHSLHAPCALNGWRHVLQPDLPLPRLQKSGAVPFGIQPATHACPTGVRHAHRCTAGSIWTAFGRANNNCIFVKHTIWLHALAALPGKVGLGIGVPGAPQVNTPTPAHIYRRLEWGSQLTKQSHSSAPKGTARSFTSNTRTSGCAGR